MSTVSLLEFLAAQGRSAADQVALAEQSFGELEFGGSMYKFAVPIISLAFLMMIAEQFLTVRGGQKADWGKPFVRTAGFMLLLALYKPFSGGIIGAVQLAGSIESGFTDTIVGDGATSTTGVLATRAQKFKEVRAQQAQAIADEEQKANGNFLEFDLKVIAEAVMTNLVDDLLYVVTWFTFTFAAFAIFAIKVLSAAVTSILLEVGPLMIAFAAIPGLTSRYLAAWCMALIEVTAWGPVASIILGLLARVNGATAGAAILEDQNYAENIILNFVYAGLFIAVPTITHMIFSGAASSVGSTGMAAAMGGLAAAGKAGAKGAGAAVDAGAAGGKAALEATGSAAAAVSSRIGDVAAGGGTQGTVDSAGSQIRSTMAGSQAADESKERRDLFAKNGAIDKQRRGD